MVALGERVTDTRAFTIRLPRPPSWWEAFRDWLKANWPLLVGVGGVVAVAYVAAQLIRPRGAT